MSLLPFRRYGVRYGTHDSQAGEVLLPRGRGPHPVVALLHGGFWRPPHSREAMGPLARYLAGHGFAVLNLDYRRLGEPGAGWPGTFTDVVDGIMLIAGREADKQLFDIQRVAIVGHCSGGHLALWAAAWLCGISACCSTEERAEQPHVRAVVTLGALTDLRSAAREGLDLPEADSPSAIIQLLGGAERDVAAHYRLGSPLELVPIGREVAQLLVHGGADDLVPVRHALDYARRATEAGDRVAVARIPGGGHFDALDTGNEAWPLVRAHLRAQLESVRSIV